MARTRVRITSLLALSAALFLTAACGNDPSPQDTKSEAARSRRPRSRSWS